MPKPPSFRPSKPSGSAPPHVKRRRRNSVYNLPLSTWIKLCLREALTTIAGLNTHILRSESFDVSGADLLASAFTHELEGIVS